MIDWRGPKVFACRAVVVLWIGVLCAGPAHTESVCLESKGCLSEPVGDKTLLVLSPEYENPAWYVVSGHGVTRLDPTPSTLNRVVSLDASPNGRFLAVVSVGEGHPELVVLDLPALFSGREHMEILHLDPYPGIVSVTGWHGPRLYLESDRPLSGRTKGRGRIAGESLLETAIPFVLDMDTGRVEPGQMPVPTPPVSPVP